MNEAQYFLQHFHIKSLSVINELLIWKKASRKCLGLVVYGKRNNEPQQSADCITHLETADRDLLCVYVTDTLPGHFKGSFQPFRKQTNHLIVKNNCTCRSVCSEANLFITGSHFWVDCSWITLCTMKQILKIAAGSYRSYWQPFCSILTMKSDITEKKTDNRMETKAFS